LSSRTPRPKQKEGESLSFLLTSNKQKQKNNIKDSNVVPHRSTNLTRQCSEQTGSGAVIVVWSFLSG
jgi:hypothetical protein